MDQQNFYAIVSTEEKEVDTNVIEYKNIPLSNLKEHGTLIRVHYSSLNYKDALSARGHKGITRKYPHVPGVDASGEIIRTDNPNLRIGDKVLVTGHDMGMNTWGGFAEFINVPSEWLVKLPDTLTTKEAMMIGTGGITSAICIHEIISSGIDKDSGPVLVTGATGAVGSTAIAILAKLGYEVIASTGKVDQTQWLKTLGAEEVIHRSDVYDTTGKPLLPKRWKAAIDTVGGNTLSTVIRSTDHHGVVCVLGLVESPELKINVFPFLQRGIRVIGIDSAERGINIKRTLWEKLASDWKPNNLDLLTREVNLSEIVPEISKILDGKQVGKVLINCSK